MKAKPEPSTGSLFASSSCESFAPPPPRRPPPKPTVWTGSQRRREFGHCVVECLSDGYHASAHGRELGVFATLIEAVIAAEAV